MAHGQPGSADCLAEKQDAVESVSLSIFSVLVLKIFLELCSLLVGWTYTERLWLYSSVEGMFPFSEEEVAHSRFRPNVTARRSSKFIGQLLWSLESSTYRICSFLPL